MVRIAMTEEAADGMTIAVGEAVEFSREACYVSRGENHMQICNFHRVRRSPDDPLPDQTT